MKNWLIRSLALATSAVTASQLIFTHLCIFQPERATLNGVGPSTEAFQLLSLSPASTLTPPVVGLSIEAGSRLVATVEGGGFFAVYREGIAVHPDDLEMRRFEQLPKFSQNQEQIMRLARNDIIVVVLPHTSAFELTIGDINRPFHTVNIDSYKRAVDQLARKLEGTHATLMTIVVRETKDHMPLSFTVVKFDTLSVPPVHHPQPRKSYQRPLMLAPVNYEDPQFSHQTDPISRLPPVQVVRNYVIVQDPPPLPIARRPGTAPEPRQRGKNRGRRQSSGRKAERVRRNRRRHDSGSDESDSDEESPPVPTRLNRGSRELIEFHSQDSRDTRDTRDTRDPRDTRDTHDTRENRRGDRNTNTRGPSRDLGFIEKQYKNRAHFI